MRERSQEKELMDLGADYYTPAEYAHCLKMLFRVNRVFGFFSSTVKALKKFPATASLVDVGCGDGLFLLQLSKYFPKMDLCGVDISAEAIALAEAELQRRSSVANNVSFKLLSQPELAISENSIDILLATMMCHHLSNEELTVFFAKAFASVRHAVIINDLQRNSCAHFFYRFISPLLFRNRLIFHDGLISIRRGFWRAELKKLLAQAGISNYQLKWRFPFRWQLILWKN
jgi:2-polyprenyl-3-methyl-5-hydroxy-6-metoxy-1,4-benzoquinol methylase